MEAGKMNDKRRRIRRLAWIVVGVVGLLVGLVTLLPTVVSLGVVREAVLARVGRAAGGSVSVETMSLAWFSGQRVTGLSFEQEGQAKLTAREVTISAGLAGLLSKRPDLGTIEIVDPDITAWLHEPSPEAGPAGRRGPAPTGRRPPTPGLVEKGAFDVRGRIVLRGGAVRVVAPGRTTSWAATNVNLSADVTSLNDPIAFDVNFAQKGADESFRANGRLRLFENGVPAPDRMAGELVVSLSEFELAPLSGLAARATGSPEAGGKVDARLSLKIVDLKHIELDGQATAVNLVLAGGPLGEDRPAFDKVSVVIKGSVSNDVIRLESARIESPPLTARASGEFRSEPGRKYPAGALTADASLDVPVLAAAFRHTLRLEKDLVVNSGRVSMKARIEAAGDRLSFVGELESKDVQATRAGQPIVLEALQLVGRGSLSEEGLALDELTLQAPFASAKGKGNADDLSIEAAIDLGRADAELRKMFDLGERSAKGAVKLAIRMKKKNDAARDLDLSCEVVGLSVSGVTLRPVVLDSVKVTARCAVKTPGNELSDLAVSVHSALANVEAQAARIATAGSGGGLEVEGGTFRADADLKALSAFARDGGWLTNSMSVTGRMTLKGNAGLQAGGLSLGPISLDVAGFSLTDGGKAMSPADIKVSLVSAGIEPAKRQLSVSQLQAQSPFGRLSVPALSVGDWSNTLATVRGQATLNSDLAAALRQAGGWSPLAKDSAVGGEAVAELTLEPEADGATRLAVGVQVERLALVSGSVTNFSDPKVDVSLDARLEGGVTNVALKTARIRSLPVVLEAAGRLANPAESRDLELDGTLEVDFARVAEIVRFVSGLDLEMEGRAARPFRLRTSLGELAAARMLSRTTASAEVYLKRLKLMGVETGEMSPSLVVSQSVARVKMGAAVNKGTLALELVADGRPEPAVLTMPENSQILKNVELSQDMVSTLLARVNPLFTGCSVLGGRIGLRMANLRVPLDSAQVTNLVFAGDVEFDGVKLAQGGLIKDIVELAKMDSSAELVVSNQTVRFACAEGRISTTPFVVMVGRDPLTISGHMTAAGALHYTAEFPVTERLVGRKNYPRVKDVKITLPIEGTVQKPQPIGEAITKAVEKLVVDVGTGILVDEGIKALDKLFAPPKKRKN